MRLRLKRAVEKSWPDLRVLLGGGAPSFVYGARAARDLPVFAYHRVDGRFEDDLQRLASAGYRTVGAAELEAFSAGEWSPDPDAVALTFDDGHASLVETAVPLLERYGFQALAFVVAGLVPESTRGSLAGWRELRDGVERGVLEVGSHSMYHHHVPVSPAILDFVTPSTDTDFAANIPIPRMRGFEAVPPGTPLFRGAPRYSLRPAFLPDPAPGDRARALVREEGDDFFRDPRWRQRLHEVTGKVRGIRETEAETEAAVLRDIEESLEIVGERCPNPGQGQLCYPWFVGAEGTDRLAGAAGVRLLHRGIDTRHRASSPCLPGALRRLPPDFLGRLPGEGRRPLSDLALRRLRGVIAGPA